jgi:hypothetical protein
MTTEQLKMLTVRIRESLHHSAKVRAAEERSTLENIVSKALEAYLKTPIRIGWRTRRGMPEKPEVTR